MHSRGSRRLWLALLLVPACTVSAPGTPASISLAIVNATVWTGDPTRPIVEAIAISDGQIAALGPTPEIRALAGDGNVLDADGALITPGFIDTHIHLLDAGRRLVQEGSSGQLYDDDESLLSIGSSAPRTPEENDEALVAALNYLVTQGVTSVHHMGNWDDLETLRRAEIQGRLTARVNVVLPIASSDRLVNAIASGQFGGEQGQGSEWVRVGAVKGVVDGTFATRTAAIDLPYPGTGDDRGLLLYDEERLYEEVVNADDAGLQVALHAVGERATNLAIDVYERVNQERDVKDRRFRLEHAQHLLDADLIRLAQLGILINAQPAQIMYAARQFYSIYDSDSRTVSFPLRTLLEVRARVAFGTDWPFAPPGPFEGLYAAVLRRQSDRSLRGGWFPNERLTISQALDAYTVNGAYASFEENQKGRLTVGNYADFILLDTNVLNVPLPDIRFTRVLLTVVGGEIVFDRRNTSVDATPLP
ncbi:MAG: amidohydrolase family protein [Vicinamibacterales bacterium]